MYRIAAAQHYPTKPNVDHPDSPMNRIGRTALLLISFSCVTAIIGCADQDRPTLYVSMVQLLANPNDYAGFPVTVSGYLSEDGSVLFQSADHAQLNDVVAGFPVAMLYRDVDISENGIARTGCENRFVRVLGVFEKRASEYTISSISKISRFDESAGLQFENEEPTGAAVVCWPN